MKREKYKFPKYMTASNEANSLCRYSCILHTQLSTLERSRSAPVVVHVVFVSQRCALAHLPSLFSRPFPNALPNARSDLDEALEASIFWLVEFNYRNVSNGLDFSIGA